MAREGEPSFRFNASPDACAPPDLLVVYPWALENVISGRPQLFRPFVVQAKYAAAKRNYHWEYEMGEENVSRPNIRAVAAQPYPDKADKIADHAKNDSGKNFPRLARTGVMDEYKTAIDKEGISGIPVALWRRFFKAFARKDPDAVSAAVDRVIAGISPKRTRLTDQKLSDIRDKLREIADLLS